MSRTTRTLRRIHKAICHGLAPSEADRLFLLELTEDRLSTKDSLILLEAIGLLRDPANAPAIEPYLRRTDTPALADEALKALWRSGVQAKYKNYMLHAIDPGFAWDTDRDVRTTALYGIGEYLRTHKDRDFAQAVARTVNYDGDPLLLTLDEAANLGAARMAASIAMGGDPEMLAFGDDEDVLKDALVARFLAERRDG